MSTFNNRDWIATEWTHAKELAAMSGTGPTIGRQVSPFYRGERFSVRQGGSVLNKLGEWEYEPLPSSRDDSFYQRCRFDSFDDAVAALMRVMPEYAPNPASA